MIYNTTELLKCDPAPSAVHVEVSGDGAVVQADPEQVQLVFQNLVMNAAQAMNGSGRADVAMTPAQGGWTVVITDHGRGMPPDVRARAFRRVLYHRSIAVPASDFR